MDGAKNVTATFELLLPSFAVSIVRRNNDPILPEDTILWDVAITNTGQVTVTVDEITATLTVLRESIIAVSSAEPVPCAPPVLLGLAEIHRCTLALVVPVGSPALLTLFVSGEGVNGTPINTTVTAEVVLTPPTALDEIDEPTMTQRLFLPMVWR